MNQKPQPKIALMIAAVVFVTAVILYRQGPALIQTTNGSGDPDAGANADAGSNDNAAPGSCTIFTVSKGDTVFFGNNEDWINPNTYIWSRQAPRDGYGAVFFGFDNLYPQGGVNEMGLAYDVNSLPEMRLNLHPERRPAPDRYGEYLLATNATVDEAITTLTGFSWGPTFGGQIHLADADGNAAVVSAGVDGELVATRKRSGPGYLVSTNFNLVAPETGDYPCERYEQATAMLEQIMRGDRLTVDQVADILDAVHQEGVDVNTMYANAVDLTRGVIYLYHGYQFDEAVTLDVSDAIDRFVEPTPIWTLFSPETVQAAENAYQRHAGWFDLAQSAAGIWLVLVGLSIPIQLWLMAQRRQDAWHEQLAWLVSTLFLGPIALAVQLLCRRKGAAGTEQTASWRCALGAALVWAAGYSFTWLLTVPYFVAAGSDVGPIEIFATLYIIPLLFGLLVLRGLPFAARVAGTYGRGLQRLAVAEWTAHNLVSGGMIAVFLLLLTRLFPNGIQVDPLVWLAFSLSTLAGALAVLPFKGWLAYRGVALWPWPASVDGEGRLPMTLNLKAGWPALALSFAFMAALVLLVIMRLGL